MFALSKAISLQASCRCCEFGPKPLGRSLEGGAMSVSCHATKGEKAVDLSYAPDNLCTDA